MGSDLDLAIIAERPISLAQGAALAESELSWRVAVADWATADEALRRITQRDRNVEHHK